MLELVVSCSHDLDLTGRSDLAGMLYSRSSSLTQGQGTSLISSCCMQSQRLARCMHSLTDRWMARGSCRGIEASSFTHSLHGLQQFSARADPVQVPNLRV